MPRDENLSRMGMSFPGWVGLGVKSPQDVWDKWTGIKYNIKVSEAMNPPEKDDFHHQSILRNPYVLRGTYAQNKKKIFIIGSIVMKIWTQT